MQTKLTPIHEWQDDRRILDGMMVVQVGDRFAVCPHPRHDQRPIMVCCPCCGAIFKTVLQAQACADRAYPPLTPTASDPASP